jgi:hypothetical protein
MARDLKKEQLKPILTILNIAKEKEYDEKGVLNIRQLCEGLEKENMEKMAGIQRKLDALKPLIDAINDDIRAINKDTDPSGNGENTIAFTVNYPNISYPYYYIPAGKFGNGGNSFNITQRQGKNIEGILNKKRVDIDLKYATIEAKIMLAEDFNAIKKILTEAGINLAETPVESDVVASATTEKNR